MRDMGHRENPQWAEEQRPGARLRSTSTAVLINTESLVLGEDVKKVAKCQKRSLLHRVGTEAPLAFAGWGIHAFFFSLFFFSFNQRLLTEAWPSSECSPQFNGRYGAPVAGCIPEQFGRSGSRAQRCVWPPYKGPFSRTPSWRQRRCQGRQYTLSHDSGMPHTSSGSEVSEHARLPYSFPPSSLLCSFPVTLTWKGTVTILRHGQNECSVSSHAC